MKIGAAWIKEGKEGRYISAKIALPFLGSINFVMFKTDLTGANAPDYEIFWNETPREKKPYTPEKNIPF